MRFVLLLFLIISHRTITAFGPMSGCLVMVLSLFVVVSVPSSLLLSYSFLLLLFTVKTLVKFEIVGVFFTVLVSFLLHGGAPVYYTINTRVR